MYVMNLGRKPSIVTVLIAAISIVAGCGGGGGNSTYMLSVAHVKELNHAMILYAGDYDDVFPLAANWMDGLGPYVPDPADFRSPAVAKNGYGYSLNSAVAGKVRSTIASPDTTLSIFDSTDLSRNATGGVNTQPAPPRYHFSNTIGYADGHVKDELGVHPSIDALYGQSVTRIKSLNTGLLIYSADYDGFLPLASNWVDGTLPYVRTISTYRSPLIDRTSLSGFGYAYNLAISGADSSGLDRGTTVTLFDSTILTRNAASTLSTLPSPARYNRVNTVVFLDGHIRDEFGANPTVDELYGQSETRLRQLNLSLLNYASDNDDRLPLANQWMDATYPYNHDSTLYRSPLVERRNPTNFGYAFNIELVGIDLSTILDPSATPTLFDSTVLARNATALPSTMPAPARYNGKNTVGYSDGHVP